MAWLPVLPIGQKPQLLNFTGPWLSGPIFTVAMNWQFVKANPGMTLAGVDLHGDGADVGAALGQHDVRLAVFGLHEMQSDLGQDHEAAVHVLPVGLADAEAHEVLFQILAQRTPSPRPGPWR